MCGFRPFFLAAAVYGAVLLPLWLGYLGAGLALPAVPGGPVVWHAHELMFGFGLAAVAGFVLTAVPEFTATAPFGRGTTLGLALLWLAARLAFWSSGSLGAAGQWLAALLDAGFAAALPLAVARRLWRDPARRHRGFLWGLAAMAATVAGFQADVLRGLYPMRWLVAAVGVMMVLIVVAMSRISMRIVNDALDAQRRRRDAEDGEADDLPAYRARPPRRNLAIFAISLCTAGGLLAIPPAVAGWLALAAAAAVLNLLNDWHVGRALLSRWAFLLYMVYWLMALGYGLLGLAQLGAPVAAGAGLHVLTVGAMGLSILAVLCIAGRTHAGLPLDGRPWVMLAAAAIGVAAAVRAAAGMTGLPAGWPLPLLAAGGTAWALAWGLAAARLAGVFVRARSDGGSGCEEASAAAGDVLSP
ncbi:NnrS family protein [Thauera sinica]|nr:NnrS family protein [Thauera sp. K11]